MPRADQRLYAALLRVTRRYEKEQIPLLGVAGSGLVCHELEWRRCLRAAVETPKLDGIGLAEGARLLTLMQRQLNTLLQSEEHTREALAEWAALAKRCASAAHTGYGSNASSSNSISGGGASGRFGMGKLRPPFAAAVALEEGLALLSRQAQSLADPLFELEQDLVDSSSSSSQDPPAVSLDDLATAVRQQHPALFPGSGGSGVNGPPASSPQGASSVPLHLQQAAAIAGVLYRQQRFKFEPFEWVYEGLSPLLLPPRLQRRKLAPVTLAAVAAGVGRRLGLPLLPVPAEAGEEIAAAVVEGPAGGAAAGGLPLEQLRPDVAQRYAGRAAAAPPTAGPWLLLLGGNESSTGSGAQHSSEASSCQGGLASSGQQQGREQQWVHAMDACTGEIVDTTSAQRKYPALQLHQDWRLLAPLVGWQHMVRTIIQAHQRRGESDLVAHWVYVLLALDPTAPEWDHLLASSP